MSTENTQTDATSSGTGAESVNTSQSAETQLASVDSNAPVANFDALKQAGKDAADGTGKFAPKPVQDALSASQTPVVPANAFTPNYKYKAALQEKEIEEFWRPLIKDADSEKRVKELLTRVDGFDFVKQSRDQVQEQYKTLEQDYRDQSQIVNRVTGAIQKNDLGSAFRQLGLSDQAIFRYTQERLQRMEMPEDQRRAFEEADQLKSQQELMQEQMTQYQSMYEQQAVQARTLQLDFSLSRPDVMSMAQNWDNLQGQPGSFKNLVIQEAQAAYYQSKQDLTPDQAIQIVMQKFGKLMSQGGPQATPQASMQSSQTPMPVVQQAKPVIPIINGKGAAPIKKAPRSIDDLKRMSRELDALENQN